MSGPSSYRLMRSRRRTLSVEVKDKKITVRAPLFLSQRCIEKFLSDKRLWIESRLKKSLPRPNNKKFVEGEEFLVLGRKHRLKLILSPKKEVNPVREQGNQARLGREVFSNGVKISGGDIIVKAADLNPKYVHKLIENFYVSTLKKAIDGVLPKYKREFDLDGRKLIVKFYRSKWGSCSAKNRLSFNAKLAMAPQRVIEYVAVHELTHLIEKNHSKRFWGVVSKFCPDYKSYRKYLNQNWSFFKF